MQEFLFDEKFGQYRKVEIETCANLAADLFKRDVSPEYIRGAMETLKKVLHLPVTFAKTPEAKEMAENMVKRNLKEFEARFIRLFVE